MIPRPVARVRRLRRLLPTILVLALGFAVLLAGLIGLWRVFHRERDQAREALAQQRQALEYYALQALEQRLDRELRTADIEAENALGDPLLAARHLLWVEGGRQLLPRVAAPVPGVATPAADAYRALLGGEVVADGLSGVLAPSRAAPDAPWSRQLALHQTFLDALRRSSDRDVEQAFRALLRHRARYLSAPERDLPAMLALLHVFRRDSSPAPELLRALLHDGLDDGRGGELESLSRLLLEHRNRFTASDFSFLGERLIDLATAAQVPYQAFLERSREHPTTVAIPDNLAPVARPFLLHTGRWLVLQEPDRLIGVKVDLGERLRDVAGEMRQRGLLIAGDDIRPVFPTESADGAASLPLDALRLEVDSPRWPRQAAEVAARYRLKVGLVVLSATLAAVMAVLGVALQARRLRLVELKSEFVATVSHELRTPLASIRLLAETVDRRAKAPELKDYPERIVREIDGLSFLVENILSFNRLERRRIEPRLSRVPLAELVEQIREDIETQVDRRVVIDGRHHSEGGQTGQGEDVVLNVDRELMKLLLLNLVRNAALYNDRDPVEITIEHREHDRGCEILVRDNGRGIPERERGKIFDEFYRPVRVSPSEGTVGGTGLGLAICRRVAELHGGKISIAASSREGTVFRIELPSRS